MAEQCRQHYVGVEVVLRHLAGCQTVSRIISNYLLDRFSGVLEMHEGKQPGPYRESV